MARLGSPDRQEVSARFPNWCLPGEVALPWGNGGSRLTIALLLTGLLFLGAGLLWLNKKMRAAEEAAPLHVSAATGTEGSQPLEILSLPVSHVRPINGILAGVLLGSGAALLLVGVITIFLPRPAPPVPARADLSRMARERVGRVLGEAADAPSTNVKVKAPDGPAPNFVVRVAPGDSATAVADKLLAAKIIADRNAFLNRLVERKMDTNLRVGEFAVPVGSTIDQVIDLLTA